MKKKAIFMALLLIAVAPLYEKGEGKFFEKQQEGEIINITVLEAWEMLQDEEDGIQLVVDDRTFQEYFTERIATPHFYDKPILYPLQLLRKPFFMSLFIMLFQEREIIIYCRTANRSYIGAKLLLDNGFGGTLYNMLGGITGWKSAGLPTVKGFGLGEY